VWHLVVGLYLLAGHDADLVVLQVIVEHAIALLVVELHILVVVDQIVLFAHELSEFLDQLLTRAALSHVVLHPLGGGSATRARGRFEVHLEAAGHKFRETCR
jgi:hypothetical protein